MALTLGPCTQESPPTPPVRSEDTALSGGETTVFETSRKAFTLSARNLTNPDRKGRFAVGNSFFNRNWVQAPSSAEGRDGLGPLFNARSCSACHLQDGRGRPPEPNQEPLSLLFRISGANDQPDPHYGGQIQPKSLPGIQGEVRISVTTNLIVNKFGDGVPYELTNPSYHFTDLAYGPRASEWKVSPRVAPAVIGLGLLESISESTLESWADPEDQDEDGISGKINRVWNVETKQQDVGRFGWKANQPTVKQQVAAAFQGDIGITSSLFPNEDLSRSQQAEFAHYQSGGDPELSDELLDDVTFYCQTLAVPARRDLDNPEVLRGETLFRRIGCAECHRSNIQTIEQPGFPELSRQIIHPYTDLLLHDMGFDLADGRPDGVATGSEWRTPPLWGIGLVGTVNKHTRFLHDGRARNLEEAVLWHGGEGAASRDHYKRLSKPDRHALLEFLNSL